MFNRNKFAPSSSSIDSTTLGGSWSVQQFYYTLVYPLPSPISGKETIPTIPPSGERWKHVMVTNMALWTEKAPRQVLEPVSAIGLGRMHLFRSAAAGLCLGSRNREESDGFINPVMDDC